MRRRLPARSRRLLELGTAALVGGTGLYLLDPVLGRGRRQEARRLLLTLRRGPARPGTGATEELPATGIGTALVRLPAASAGSAAEEDYVVPVPPERGEGELAERERVVFLHEARSPAPKIVAYDMAVPTAPATASPRHPHEESGRAILARRRSLAAPLAAFSAVAACVAVGLGVWAVARPDAPDPAGRALADQAEAIAVLSRPGARRIPVTGSRGTIVLVTTPSGRAVLILTAVPPAPAGKTYQAWAIEGKKAGGAGLFPGGGGQAAVPLTSPVTGGTILAVTLEPTGGSTSPTGKVLYSATVGRS